MSDSGWGTTSTVRHNLNNFPPPLKPPQCSNEDWNALEQIINAAVDNEPNFSEFHIDETSGQEPNHVPEYFAPVIVPNINAAGDARIIEPDQENVPPGDYSEIEENAKKEYKETSKKS
ncbi:hypothetical protein NQ314_012041 [Rhamnusium bicolor]|uniref:Uncharacterized protein n=1 Tax=Rhamnusium bicolor TaxID=1586634 RepID=A0AAV8XGA8_9CUCU|nr:hypothetical protein NQ314_012041 [Rhamnusium bicolor]